MTAYVFLLLFVVAAALNVVGTKTKKKTLFNVTKPLLLLLICAFVAVRTLPDVDLLLVAAFAACFLGDVLLMPKGRGWFVAGGLSFFAGHALLIVVFARSAGLSRVPLAALVFAGVFYLSLALAVMVLIQKSAPAILRVPLFLYLLCNSATNLLALSRLIASPGIYPAAAFVGAALFFLSDCALFLLRFEPDKPRFFKSNFFVMLTYASAVLLLAPGLTG